MIWQRHSLTASLLLLVCLAILPRTSSQEQIPVKIGNPESTALSIGHTDARQFSSIAELRAGTAVPPTKPFRDVLREVSPESQKRIVDLYGQLPLSFEANKGQTDTRVTFLARGRGHTLFLSASEAVLLLRQPAAVGAKPEGDEVPPAVLRMKLVGANPESSVAGLQELPGKSNYFIGNDPTQWRTNVSTYARVRYEQIYPGVDLVYYGNQRQLEYDFVVAPGADPHRIQLAFEGAKKLKLDVQGDLVLQTWVGEVRFHKPVVYQWRENAGAQRAPLPTALEKHFFDGRYVLQGKTRVSFQVASYDTSKPLIIDPVLRYATFLGGSQEDVAYGIAVDAAGSTYVTGTTASANFPITAGAVRTALGGTFDTFVTKLNPAGSTLVYSTFLGGNGDDRGEGFGGIAVDADGNAYVITTSSSTDFPTTATAFQRTLAGSSDVTVTKLNGDGSALLYSTYLGGSGQDQGRRIAVDVQGNAYATGRTASSNFPTTPGAFQTTFGGDRDAFVSKLLPDGTALVYSTYLGGRGTDVGRGIVVDAAGETYLFGRTTSTNFPTTPGAFQRSAGGGGDVFLTKLAADGSRLIYSTYLGGSGIETEGDVAVDATGNAYVTGVTGSEFDFPVTLGAFQTTSGGGGADAFVAKLNAAGSALVFSSFLGGGDPTEAGFGIAIDAQGNVYVTGTTGSTDFPVTPGAFQTSFGGGHDDAFVTVLNSSGSALLFSSYLGGTGDDLGFDIVLDINGDVYLAGATRSPNFPTVNPFQPAFSGVADGFIARIARIVENPAGLPNSANLTLIPHFVLGGGYVTRVFVKNLSNSNNNLAIQFRTQMGTLDRSEALTLSPSQVIERTSGEVNRSAPIATQWIASGSDGTISASVLFDCCASGSQVTSAVGVLAQVPGTTFTAPFLFQRQTTDQPILVEGLGIANRSDSANTVIVRLLDQTGNQLSSDTLSSIPPYGQTAFTVSDLPGVSAQLQGRDIFLGSLVITGTQPFAPVYVGNLGGRLFSLPLTLFAPGSPVQLSGDNSSSPAPHLEVTSSNAQVMLSDAAPALPSSPNLGLIPHFVIGGGYVTRLLVKNLAGSNNLTIQYMTQNGVAVSRETLTLAAGQTIQRTSGEANRSAALTVQWIAVGSDAAITASVLFDCCAAGPQVTSAVGVLAQAAGTTFTAPFIFQREIAGSQAILVEGVAVANRSDQSNTITVRLFDENNTPVASETLTALVGFGQTAFTVSDSPSVSSFLTSRNTFLGSIVISGTQPFAPVIVGNLGGRLFSLPLTAQ